MSSSNSLIIHQEKTKKIATVTVVWICVPNYHKILPTLTLNFSKNYRSFESHIKHSKVCLIRYLNTSKSFIKTRLRLVFFFFNLLLSVWISDERRFLVFDILRQCHPSLSQDYTHPDDHNLRTYLLTINNNNNNNNNTDTFTQGEIF